MTNQDAETPLTKADIQAAIDGRQFSLNYQPKIDCETIGLKGFEALVRWNHPTKGLILPDQFISIAEDTGMIGRLTEEVVDQAFRWHKAASHVPGLTLSINFSARRLSDMDFADWLQKMCRAMGIRPETVILEISETAVLGERLLALDMFTRLRTKGFRVAIDDFGMGSSSLALLARLPFSEVNIDKSYAMTATASEESKSFIQSTVKLAHSLKLSVVAEGVEDRETLDFLRQIGCDFAHGFLIARPMPGEEALEWILNRRQMTRHILV